MFAIPHFFPYHSNKQESPQKGRDCVGLVTLWESAKTRILRAKEKKTYSRFSQGEWGCIATAVTWPQGQMLQRVEPSCSPVSISVTLKCWPPSASGPHLVFVPSPGFKIPGGPQLCVIWVAGLCPEARGAEVTHWDLKAEGEQETLPQT